MNIKEFKTRIENDSIMLEVLRIIDELQLEDAWLCAGTLRNFLWNYLSGKENFDFSTDVDVVFYDKKVSYESTLEIQEQLYKKYPQFHWEIKNQVYMHSHNPNTRSYKSSCDAIAKFPEICTAIGAKLNDEHTGIELFCPYGIDDIVQFKVRPTPYFKADAKRKIAYNKRIVQKNWKDKWPWLSIFMFE